MLVMIRSSHDIELQSKVLAAKQLFKAKEVSKLVGTNYFRYSMFAMFAGMALTLFDLRLS